MKNKKLIPLCLLSALTLTTIAGCSVATLDDWTIPSVEETYIRPKEDTKFNKAVKALTSAGKSNNEEIIVKAYNQINSYLDYLHALKIAVSKGETNLSSSKIGDEMTYLYYYYWNKYSSAMDAYKYVLQTRGKDAFTNLVGSEKATVYSSLEINKMFIKRASSYKKPTENFVTQYTDKITKLCTSSLNGSTVYTCIAYAITNLYTLLEYYSILTIKSNIDITDGDLSNDLVYLINLITTSQNEYTKALKTAFSSPCRSYLEQKFGADVVASFLQTAVTYSDDVLNLQKQDSLLVNQYMTASDTETRKEIYLNLLNIRSQLNTLLNQENPSLSTSTYEEYEYKYSYARDYTPDEAYELTNNVATILTSLWQKANEENLDLSGSTTEDDLWHAITYVDNIASNAHEVASYIKNYGLYTFDVSPHKYTGSYVIGMNNMNYSDSYLYLGATGTISDYSTAFHEFGHYYANYTCDESLATSSTQSLDLAEINSQGLELLMMDYYNQFLSEEDALKLEKNQMINALWAIFSGSAVAEFEHKAYSYQGTLDVETLDSIWASIKDKYNLNKSSISYEIVPHIYQQPGYYISYVTSMISSFELWTLPKDQAINTYNELAKIGSKNPYLSTLEKYNLSNPFNGTDYLDKISQKIDTIL